MKILYRGPLSSCNYGCAYCPFAKREESRDELAVDRAALDRFVAWVQAQRQPISIFFTPWGEALIRPWYQDALVALSRLSHVVRAAIQTNLSGRTEWVGSADPTKIGIWATYHPEWADRARFVEKLLALYAAGASVSAGVVGFPDYHDEIVALRRELPAETYVWINAVKKIAYTDDQLAAFTAIDPLFPLNLRPHPSRGHACRAGHDAFSVDGDGTVRRCHFIKDPIGNLYDGTFAPAAAPQPCTNDSCGCHIGYVHLEYLELDKVFGSGILERSPDLPLVHIQAVAPQIRQ
jgi:MoaA/NifB/PqqE/SkfB family radical SAM enzyme